MIRLVCPFAAFALLAFAVTTPAATIHVPEEQPTIQEGIDAASQGDTVLVAPGVYTGPQNRDLDFGGKHISLLSQAGRDVTVIDCQTLGRGFHFHGGEGPSALVHGFTITDGRHYSQGGGIMCYGSSPTISDCSILNCSSDDGGGMFCDQYSNPYIEACVFSDNYAAFGGGLFCELSSPTITNCEFSGNQASARGGGMFCHHGSSPSITGCVFTDNHVGWDGGGMFCYDCSPELENCVFSYNSADDGGGVFCDHYSEPMISNCTFLHNSASFGGGLLCEYSSPTVEYCTFWDNHATGRGGGIFCHQESSPTVFRCTLSGNGASEGGGVFCYGSAFAIASSIIAFGTAGLAVECEGGGSVTLTCSDVYGNAGGDWVGCIAGQGAVGNNLSEDPLFCGAGIGDFTLHDDSPCVDGPCALIGALGVGCPSTPVEATSWGSIKALFGR